jgi:4-amino-4-deoxy-L-arabinose transferase-like glycosyltransferase
LLVRLGLSLSVLAAALLTRSLYMDDMLRAERARDAGATFRDAILPNTQKFTLDYETRALRILDGGGVLYSNEQPRRELEIAHPPGYQVFIAAVYWTTGKRRLKFVTLAQLWLDALAAGAVAFVVSGLWGKAAGALGGALIALSPHLAWNSLVPMPDTPYAWPIVAAVLVLLAALRSGHFALYALAGLLLALACWLRANALLLPPLLGILAYALAPQRGAWRPALVVAVAWLLISPITIRNYRYFGVFLPLGWGAGRTLIEGLADYDFEGRFGLPKFDRDLTRWDEQEGITSHLQREELLRRKSLEVIRGHPLWYASVVLRRALFQWSYDVRSSQVLETPFDTRVREPVAAEGTLLPLRLAVRGLQGLWWTPMLRALTLAGAAALWLAGRRQELLLFLAVPAYYFAVQSALHTEYRYCLPLHYFLFPVIGFGMARCVSLARPRAARA